MLLTAIKRDDRDQTCERIPFYAAIDTGATRTLCSRDLAQKLFGHWNPDGHQQYRMFNGQLIRCEVMKEQLELENRDGTITRFRGVYFVNQDMCLILLIRQGLQPGASNSLFEKLCLSRKTLT